MARGAVSRTVGMVGIFITVAVASTLAHGSTSTQSRAALYSIRVYVWALELLTPLPLYQKFITYVQNDISTLRVQQVKLDGYIALVFEMESYLHSRTA
ncbi:unnamed protein product [Colias eurytheme]|nr:unnamed protein product [Colias eurytheme]